MKKPFLLTFLFYYYKGKSLLFALYLSLKNHHTLEMSQKTHIVNKNDLEIEFEVIFNSFIYSHAQPSLSPSRAAA